MRTGYSTRTRLACCLAAAAALALLSGPAAAQNLFDLLFGHHPPAQPAPQAYAEPSQDFADPVLPPRARRASPPTGGEEAVVSRAGGEGAVVYCVRLCDGRYFPLQRHTEASPVELCNAFCPAARTKIFFGGDINGARASDGTRYSALQHAFLYRQRLVPDCTCNGKTPSGLAAIDPEKDPTLRPGDIVATKRGLMAYQGSRWRRGTETANFTPIDRSRLSHQAGL